MMKMIVLLASMVCGSAAAYPLTDEERSILAHIVVDPQAWADHAEVTVGAAAVLNKIEKYRAAYKAAKTAEGPRYKTRAEKCAVLLRDC